MSDDDGTGGSTGGHRAVVERNAVKDERIHRLEGEVYWSRRVLLGVLPTVLATHWLSKNEPRIIAIGQDARIVPIVTLDKPVMPDGAVLDFAVKAVRETMTFGYHDFEMRLGAAQRDYFTDDGFADFSDALIRQRIIEGVRKRGQVYQASIGQKAPALVDKKLVRGVLKYWVEVALQVNVMSGGKTEAMAYPVRLRIARAMQVDKPYGVAIEQWAAVLS